MYIILYIRILTLGVRTHKCIETRFWVGHQMVMEKSHNQLPQALGQFKNQIL